jgi:hypothetical protein
MKRLITIVFLLALAGCANLKFQWSASYATDNLLVDLENEAKSSELAK